MTSTGLVSVFTVLSIAALSLGCGHYRKTESGDAVLASTWSNGSPVHLVQHYVRRSDYVGFAPHIVDPATVTGRLAVVLPSGRRIEPDLIPWNAWGSATFAVARPEGRGFLVGMSGGAKGSACLLVSVTGNVERCAEPISIDRLSAPSADVMLFRDVPRQTIRMYEIQSAAASEASDAFLTLPWSDQRPCAMDYAALSPDRQQWVIACLRQGRYGLWLQKRSEPTDLLTSDAVRLPRTSLTDLPVPAYERFTLAWSPDMQLVYYCDGTDGDAVIVHVNDRRAQRVKPCLAFAAVSAAPYRIVGSLPTGKPGEAALNLE